MSLSDHFYSLNCVGNSLTEIEFTSVKCFKEGGISLN